MCSVYSGAIINALPELVTAIYDFTAGGVGHDCESSGGFKIYWKTAAHPDD